MVAGQSDPQRPRATSPAVMFTLSGITGSLTMTIWAGYYFGWSMPPTPLWITIILGVVSAVSFMAGVREHYIREGIKIAIGTQKTLIERITTPAISEDKAPVVPELLLPNITFVSARKIDVYFWKDNSCLFGHESYGTSRGAAVVLVFSNDPADRPVGMTSNVRAQIKINDLRVPTAQWLGYADSAEFPVGATHELILAVQFPRYRNYEEGFHAVEFRRQRITAVLPLRYTKIADKFTATAALFDVSFNREFDFDVDLSATPIVVALKQVR